MAGQGPDPAASRPWSASAALLSEDDDPARSAPRPWRRSATPSAPPTPPPTPTRRPARRRLRPGLRPRTTTDDRPETSTRAITYSEAIREAIGQAMEADDRVFMLGEDIGVYGGAFGVSGDLYHRFGADRIRDTPISELGIVGAAVGAALAGMRPIVEIQFSDFTSQAMDQIVNQAAKIHFMLGGAATVPMVLRAPLGLGHRRRGPALAEPGGLVRPRARPQGGHAGDRRRTPRACCCPRSTTPTRSSCSSTSCCTAPPARCPRRPCGSRSARPPSAARGADLTIVATGVMVVACAGGRRDPRRRRASTSPSRPAHPDPARRRPDPRGRRAHRSRAARAGGARPRRVHRRDRRPDHRVAHASTGCWPRSGGSAASTRRSPTPRSSRPPRSPRSTTSSTPRTTMIKES